MLCFLGQDLFGGVEIIITHMQLITHAMSSSRNIIGIGIGIIDTFCDPGTVIG